MVIFGPLDILDFTPEVSYHWSCWLGFGVVMVWNQNIWRYKDSHPWLTSFPWHNFLMNMQDLWGTCYPSVKQEHTRWCSRRQNNLWIIIRNSSQESIHLHTGLTPATSTLYHTGMLAASWVSDEMYSICVIHGYIFCLSFTLKLSAVLFFTFCCPTCYWTEGQLTLGSYYACLEFGTGAAVPLMC